jgi:riboflavin biosynthesis pyrimidine reductase
MRLLYQASDPAAGGELTEHQLSELYRHPLPGGRPVWLRSNFVTSLDGSIQGPDGRSGTLNTRSDQHVFALHRAHADAILVGAQTVRSEGYRAVDLAPWQRELRAAEGLSDFPLLAVVTRSLDLDPEIARHGSSPVGRVLVLTTRGKTAAELAPLSEAGIEVVQLGDVDVDLSAGTARLAEAGCRRLLCEGGSRLHRDLLAADLLDEMSLTLAPVAVGGAGRRTTVGDPLPDVPAFHLTSALYAADNTLFVNYRRDGRQTR